MTQQFVSVIGPNGSGKSNLLESLLFIFGHRASRMRLKQLKELIHNSATRFNVDKAQVSVTFKEIEEVESIDQADGQTPRVVETFTIARNIFSENSSSNYEINGVAKHRVDVVDLLKSKGMDMNNNRFLILQGEVEQISLMKPITGKREEPGLLEYLEDIIGSYKYVDQIVELGDTLTDIRKAKETELLLLHDLTKELESMADSKASAVAYFEIQNQLFSLNNVKYYLEMADTRETDARLHETIGRLNDELEADKKKLHETAAVYKSDFMVVKRLDDKKKQSKAEHERIDELIKNAGEDDQRFQSRIRSILTESHENESQIKKLQADVAKASEARAEKEAQLPSKKEEEATVRELLHDFQARENEILQRIEPQILQIKRKIEEVREKKTPLESDLRKQEDHKKRLLMQLETLDKRDQTIDLELEKLEKDYRDCHKVISREAERKEQLTIEFESSKERLIAYERKIKDLEGQEMEANKKAKQIDLMLEERSHRNQSGLQKNNVLMYLMNSREIQAQGGRIYGRIGDLGWIDPRYDIAISSVSPKFNNILVDTIDTATLCMKLLKRDRIGMVRMIALEAIRGLGERLQRPFQAPPNSVRVFDLVKKRDEAAELAFYYVLKDVVVTKDLDTAQQVNTHNGGHYMVVTLQGYMISAEGTMSGGGRPRTGAVLLAGQASQMMDVEEVPTEVLMQDKERLLSGARMAANERDSTKKEAYQAQIAIARIPATLKAIEEAIASETYNLNQIQAKQTNLEREKNDGRLQQARRENQAEIDKIHNNISNLVRKMNEIKAVEEDLEGQIESVGGRDLKEIKAKVTAYKASHETAQKIVNELEAHIKQTFTTIERKNAEIEDLTLKISQNNEEKANLIKQKEACEQLARELFERKKVCVETEKQVDEEYNQIMNKIQNIASTLEGLKVSRKVKLDELEKTTKQQQLIREETARIKDRLRENKRSYLHFVESYKLIEDIKKIEKRSNSQVTQDSAQVARSAARQQVNPILEHFTPDKDITLEEIKQMNLNLDSIKSQIAYLMQRKDSLNGDIEVIESYKEKLGAYVKKDSEFKEASSKEQLIKSDLNKLKESRRIEFMTGFAFISKKLKDVYQTITNGGDADLELIDSMDPFSEGVMFSVRPPHKSWKHMSKLSGGEKTLSSLSLIFALHYYKPTPIYFMDEIDAALDFRNVEIVGKFIKERTRNAQFIVISLRNHMFELANQLVGIYKVNDMTRTVSLYPYQFLGTIEEDMRKEEEIRKTQSANRSQVRSQMQSKTSVSMAQETQPNPSKVSHRRSVAAALASRQSRPLEPAENFSPN